jgi:hypothetical protein
LASWCAHLSKRFLESAYAVTARLDDLPRALQVDVDLHKRHNYSALNG